MHTFIELRILYFVRNFYFSSHADCFSSFINLFDDFLKKLFYNVLRRFQAVSTFSAWILGSYLLIQEKTRVDLTKRYKFTQKWQHNRWYCYLHGLYDTKLKLLSPRVIENLNWMIMKAFTPWEINNGLLKWSN